MSLHDGLILFTNDGRQVKLDGAVVVVRPVTAQKNVGVVLLYQVSIPFLNISPVAS